MKLEDQLSQVHSRSNLKLSRQKLLDLKLHNLKSSLPSSSRGSSNNP